jgi:hypothetical protein
MKKIILIVLAITLLSSCYKDRKVIRGQCGIVVDNRIRGNSPYYTYLLVVRFQDGVTREVPVTTSVWINFSRGETVCW